MIDEKDIIDLIAGELANKKTENENVPYKSGFFTKGGWIKSYSTLVTEKKLITESDIRKIIAAGSRTLKISPKTIIGPLALEIIQEKGIKVIRE